MAKRKGKGRSRARRPAGAPGGSSQARRASTPAPTRARPRAGAGPANRARGPIGVPARRRWGRPLTIAISALVLLGGYYGYLWIKSRQGPGPLEFASPAASLSPSDLPGLQAGPPPWGAALGTLHARLDSLGLPARPAEVLDLHFHLHLDVVVDGRPVPVPDDIGRNADAGFIASLHTHDGSGIIHVESPKGLTYTLGQLFDVWGVRFTSTCLGGDCDAGDRRVRVFADGTELRRDPRLLILARHQEIVVTYGTPAQVPRPVPSRYSFPIGA